LPLPVTSLEHRKYWCPIWLDLVSVLPHREQWHKPVNKVVCSEFTCLGAVMLRRWFSLACTL
jgi:hypothetical protein